MAWEAKKPLAIEEIEVDPPKEGEVRLRVYHNAVWVSSLWGEEGRWRVLEHVPIGASSKSEAAV